ncbi:MAG: DUF5320 domain-containing protein [Methanomicrobiaceae archaeon]|nr:DUF5320 domain-containing protein [Methanomicrobiaceae archaeon]
MPGFDGTGPRGLGRMTGRKFGPCNPANTAEKTAVAGENVVTENAEQNPAQNVVYGLGRGGVPRGCGQGFGGGRGRRGNFRRY